MIAINAVKAINTLRAIGFNDALAAAVVEAIAESIDTMTATKLDLANSTNEVRQELAAFRSSVSAEFAAARSEFAAGIASVRSDLFAEIADVRQSVTRLERAMTRLIAESNLKMILWIGAIFAVVSAISKIFS